MGFKKSKKNKKIKKNRSSNKKIKNKSRNLKHKQKGVIYYQTLMKIVLYL